MQIIMIVALAVAAILGLGLVFEALASDLDRKRFPPPGRLIDVGGRKLHLLQAGAGTGPTVVIEAGRFNISPMWSLVQESVSAFATVCTYDRAGYAWSDPDRGPRTGERVAEDLHKLLRRAEVPGPYILVGHSLGALYVLCFAQAHPDEVAGVILVDPYTPGEVLGQPPKMRALQAQSVRMIRIAAQFGMGRLFVRFMRGMVGQLARFPAALQRQIVALTVSARLWRAVDAEWQQVEALARQMGGPGSLGDLPLAVLSAERCDMKAGGGFTQTEVDDQWRLMKRSQADLVGLSSCGRLVLLPDTGHAVPLERPEAVVDAVREMLLTARPQA